MRGSMRSSTTSAGNSARAFFNASAPSLRDADEEPAGFAQLHRQQIDDVAFVFDEEDFFVRRKRIHARRSLAISRQYAERAAAGNLSRADRKKYRL